LFPMRRLRDRIASLGCTVLDRMTSEISRFAAISSLKTSIDIKMEGCMNVQAGRCCALDLLVEGGIAGTEPSRHHRCKVPPSDSGSGIVSTTNGEARSIVSVFFVNLGISKTFMAIGKQYRGCGCSDMKLQAMAT